MSTSLFSRALVMHGVITTTLAAVLFCVFLADPASATLTVAGNMKISGNLTIMGTLSKSSGTFVIDHPLDPENKLLYHSFVESPEVKNVYDGIVTLDQNGEATIELPGYFEALNTSFRYQFSAVGQPMPNLHVVKKIEKNSFSLGGGVAGGIVSWQVTGNRHDAFIVANPIIPEVKKSPTALKKRGECIYEPLCE